MDIHFQNIILSSWLIITFKGDGTIEKCPDPGTPENGVRRISDESLRIDTWIEFTCNTGHTLQGQRLMTCMDSGQWDSQRPLCIRDTCL